MANDDDYIPLFQYDVALSFAGEDRGIVESIARQLVDCDVKVFYDEFVTHELWGKDLFQHLSAVSRQSQILFGFCFESIQGQGLAEARIETSSRTSIFQFLGIFVARNNRGC